MKRLILMRHAKTEPWHESVDDHGRALVERGFTDAAAVGAELASRGWLPDSALVSTARRARETWKAASAGWGEIPAILDEAMYLAAPQTIDAVLSANSPAGTLIVVGHNPGLHEFACMLDRRGPPGNPYAHDRLFEKFPTGCVALFEAGEEVVYHSSAFQLVDIIRPRDLEDED